MEACLVFGFTPGEKPGFEPGIAASAALSQRQQLQIKKALKYTAIYTNQKVSQVKVEENGV